MIISPYFSLQRLLSLDNVDSKSQFRLTETETRLNKNTTELRPRHFRSGFAHSFKTQSTLEYYNTTKHDIHKKHQTTKCELL